MGSTAFAIDYGDYNEVAQNNDDATSWGLMAVQNFSDWGTDIYALFRNYELSRTSASYDDIDVFMAGARVKF